MSEKPKAEKPEKEEKPKAEKPEVKDVAEAVVFNGKIEVRKYTKEKNGDDFVKLAESFVSNPKRKGYTVEVR